jgi:hypothetical protein
MNFDDTARFWGPSQKLWPELFRAPCKVATTLCRECRKVPVEGIRRYCGRCGLKRKLASTRRSKRAKKGLNGRKTENSAIAAEALTKAEMSGRYDDPRTSISRSSFSSTGKRLHSVSRKPKRVSKIDGV